MKTYITVTFQNERLAAITTERTVSINGPVTLPEIGERVRNPAYGPNEPLSGKLASRSYAYKNGEVSVLLVLHDN